MYTRNTAEITAKGGTTDRQSSFFCTLRGCGGGGDRHSRTKGKQTQGTYMQDFTTEGEDTRKK